MNIFHEKTNGLSGVLKIQINENDYSEKVNNAMRDLQKKAQMPGFRTGKVPMGIIKKLHGKDVLIEQVNKLTGEAVYEYIKEKELNILGNPLPVQDQNKSVDWENQKEFEFHFSIGFAPGIELTLSDKIKVEYYKIKIGNKLVNEQINNLQHQQGKIINPEKSGDDKDSLFGEFVQMDSEEKVAEEPLIKKSKINIEDIKDKKIRNDFLSRKVGDQIVFDINKAFESKDKISKVLDVDEEKLPEKAALFRFTVETISRIEPAELNDEFFKKVSPGKTIADEDELKKLVSEEISKRYQDEVDRYFRNEVIETLLEMADIQLPEEFIKQWLIETNKEELTKEKVEAEFDQYADSLRWQLLESKITEDHNIKVTDNEVKDHLREYVKAQLSQYGQNNPEKEMVENFVNNIMEKEEEVKKVREKLFDDKLIKLFKNTLKLKEKEVTFDEFSNLVKEKFEKKQKKSNAVK